MQVRGLVAPAPCPRPLPPPPTNTQSITLPHPSIFTIHVFEKYKNNLKQKSWHLLTTARILVEITNKILVSMSRV